MGRYQWIVDRLDLIQDDLSGPFSLFLSSEPTFVAAEAESLDTELVDTELARRSFKESSDSRREVERTISDQILSRLDWLQRDFREVSLQVRPEILPDFPKQYQVPFKSIKLKKLSTHRKTIFAEPLNLNIACKYFTEESRVFFDLETKKILSQLNQPKQIVEVFKKGKAIVLPKKILSLHLSFKRNAYIVHKEKISNRQFAIKHSDQRIQSALLLKQRGSRIRQARKRIQLAHQARALHNQRTKKNQQKLNLKREKNIAQKSKQFVLNVEDPPKRRIPDIKAIDDKIAQLEGKTSNSDKMEYIKCMQWKQTQRIRLAQLEAAKESEKKKKVELANAERIASIRRMQVYEAAQQRREEVWIAREKERNARVVANAKKYVSLCNTLVPCLGV